jgi:hypothetical protein
MIDQAGGQGTAHDHGPDDMDVVLAYKSRPTEANAQIPTTIRQVSPMNVSRGASITARLIMIDPWAKCRHEGIRFTAPPILVQCGLGRMIDFFVIASGLVHL